MGRVIAVVVGHNEYVDDQKPLTPQSDELPNGPSLLYFNDETTPPEDIGRKPKTKSRDKTTTKILAKPVVGRIAEPIAEPVVEHVVETVNMKNRKPANKQPKPINQDPAAEPDLEDLIAKRKKAMRDASELNNRAQMQSRIAPTI